MTPKSHDHVPTTSLWGVAAKWPTRAPKTKLILCPKDPQGYGRIILSLSGRILKSTGTSCQLRHAVFHGVCEIALTEVLATQMGEMRRSKKVSSFELYKFNPLSPHYRSIAWELVHCYTQREAMPTQKSARKCAATSHDFFRERLQSAFTLANQLH